METGQVAKQKNVSSLLSWFDMNTTYLLVTHSKHHALMLMNGYFRDLKLSLHLQGILEIITNYFLDSAAQIDGNTIDYVLSAANSTRVPIKFKQLLQLSSFSINNEEIRFANIKPGGKYLCIKQSNSIVIINHFTKSTKVMKETHNVDIAVPNPILDTLALVSNSAVDAIQIIDINTNNVINSLKSTMIESDHVTFCKWINTKTVAFMTGNSIYHWNIEDNPKPIKTMDIRKSVQGLQLQLINYQVSMDNNWFHYQGLLQSASIDNYKLKPVAQLYNVTLDKYQPNIEAYGACFANIRYQDRDALLYCFTKKANEQQTKLFICEIGHNDYPLRMQIDFTFQIKDDFVINIIPSNTHKCLFAISFYGYLLLFDIIYGRLLSCKKISNSVIIFGSYHEESDGIMILDRNGRLNLFSIDADKHRVYTAKIRASYQTGPYLANPPPMSYNPGPNKKIFQTRFDQLLNKLQIDPAKKLLIEAPQQVLQDADNIEKLRAAMDNFGHQSLEDYVELDKLEIKCIEREIKNKRFLGEEDSMRYCKLIFKMKPKDEAFKEIELHLRNVILLNCEKLGDLFMENLFFKGACSVYYRTKSHNKCIQCMIMMDDTEKIIKYCESVNYSPDWQKLLTDISIPKTNGIKDFIQTLIDKQYLPADYINL